MKKHTVKLIRQKNAATCWVACCSMLNRWRMETLFGEKAGDFIEELSAKSEPEMQKVIDSLNRGMNKGEIRNQTREWGFDFFDRNCDKSDIKTYGLQRPICWAGRKQGYHGEWGGKVPVHCVIIRGFKDEAGRLKLWLRDPATPHGSTEDTAWTEWYYDDLVAVFPSVGFYFRR